MRMLVAAMLLIASSFSAPQCIADGDHDTAAILGEWRVVSMEARGRADSGVSFQGMRYSFDNETWTTWPGETTPAGIAGKPPLKLKYTIDNAEEPKHLDIVFTSATRSVTKKAIFKIQDGKLYLCLGRDERPTSFGTEGTNNSCYVAERVAAEAPKTPR